MMGELMRYLWGSMPVLIAALVGTLGFAMLFKMKAKYLIYISVCGFVSYGIYLSVLFLGYSEILAAFASASFVAIASEILARVLKAPTVIFTVVGIVPIVPGSALYYSMRNLLLRDIDGFFDSLKSACTITAGIVFGIVAISALMKLLTSLKRRNRKETE